MTQPARMWPYWRDDKGLKDAATDYFPELFQNDPVLAFALAQINAAEFAIDTRMAQLAAAEERGTTPP